MAVRDVVDRPRDRDDRAEGAREQRRGVERGFHLVGRVDPATARTARRERDDLRRVAAHDRRRQRHELVREPRPHGQRSDGDGIQHPRRPRLARRVRGLDRGLPLLRVRRAEVDEQARRDPRERPRLGRHVRHRGRGAQRQQDVRGEAGDDRVRDALHERLALPQQEEEIRRGGPRPRGLVGRWARSAHDDIPPPVRTGSGATGLISALVGTPCQGSTLGGDASHLPGHPAAVPRRRARRAPPRRAPTRSRRRARAMRRSGPTCRRGRPASRCAAARARRPRGGGPSTWRARRRARACR